MAGSLPSIATRAITVLEQLETMSRDGLQLAPETIAAIARARSRQLRWRTIGVWVIALSFLGLLLSVR